MQTWIYLVMIAELVWAVTSLIDKIVLSKGHIRNPFVYIIINGIRNILVIFLIPFFGIKFLGWNNIFIALLGATAFTFGIIFYYKSVRFEEISRVIMLWQMLPIFVLFLSFLFLGEVLTKNYLIGFAFLLAAGIVVSYKKGNKQLKLSKAFYYMLASTALISIFYVFSKRIYSVTDFWNAFLWLRIADFVPMAFLFVPSIRQQFIQTYRNAKINIKGLVLFKMVVDFSAFIPMGYALLKGPASLISALGSASSPIFVFLMTLTTSLYFPFIVKEAIDRKTILMKLAAIALIVLGVVFVNS